MPAAWGYAPLGVRAPKKANLEVALPKHAPQEVPRLKLRISDVPVFYAATEDENEAWRKAMVARIEWSDEQTNAAIVHNILHHFLDYARGKLACEILNSTSAPAPNMRTPESAVSQFVCHVEKQTAKRLDGQEGMTHNDEAALQVPASDRAAPGQSTLEKMPTDIFIMILRATFPPRRVEGTADAYGALVIEPHRHWADIPLYHVSHGLRKLAVETYGQPVLGFFPFDALCDTLSLEFSSQRTAMRLPHKRKRYTYYVTDPAVASERFQRLMDVQHLRRIRIVNLETKHVIHNAPKDRVAWPDMLDNVQKHFPNVTHLRLVIRGTDACCTKPQYPTNTPAPYGHYILTRACWEAYRALEKVLTGSLPIRPLVIKIARTAIDRCTVDDELCVAIPVPGPRSAAEPEKGESQTQ